jgi:hypothetical protein
MTRSVVEVSGQTYTISPDDTPALAGRTWGVISAWVVDEITGRPPRSRLTLSSTYPGLSPRLASDGLIGLVGIPTSVFPALDTQSYPVQLTIQAEGYLPRQEEVIVAANADFPNDFTPAELGSLALHREPLVIHGRTVLAGNTTTTPISGVSVRITGIWRTPPPAHLIVPAEAPDLISLQPPLYAGYAAITGHLQGQYLPPIAGDDKFLLGDAPKGTSSLQLSNRQNIGLGDILLIDAKSPDLAEYLGVVTIAGASSAAQPAAITLDYALAYTHRQGALIQKVNPQALGAQKQLTQAALDGDACIFLNDVTGLETAHEVQITGGLQPPEYHRCRLFEVTSDAEGYFRFPPLHRVAQVEIQAEMQPPPPPPIPVAPPVLLSPDYTSRENCLDIIFQIP